VVSAVLAVLTANAGAVGTAIDFATAAARSATPAEVGVVVKLTVGAGDLLDWALAGVDDSCSVSGAGAAGGVLG
jgi:hypothetical protein